MALQEYSPLGLHTVDDFYFSALFDDVDEANRAPVSDDKYAEELQFQETLMASVITSQNASSSPSSPPPPPPPLAPSLPCVASSSSNAADVSLVPKSERIAFLFPETEQIEFLVPKSEKIEFLLPKTEQKEFLLPKTELIEFATEEEEEAGESSLIICEICAEAKESEEMFRNLSCDHSFCSDCVTKQVATKLQDNITVVSCPGLNCKGVLELDVCRPMLPKDLIERWDDALCEALLLTVSKLYCPFNDCSAMLLDDNEGEDIRESECPFCHRLFCASCNVPWHPGVGCDEFQTLNEYEKGTEDLLVRELANQKKWGRCPKCKFYVEKTEGCLHITCRCQFEFCYACGEQWTSTHGGCQRN